MGAYITPPVFHDNVGQLVSQADLEILRHNVSLAEVCTWRWSEMFASSGGVETGISLRNYGGQDNDVRLVWPGYLMIKAGMTTLTIEGRSANVGSSVFALYLDGTFKQSWTPGTSSWTRTQSLSGYSAGDVVKIEITVTQNAFSSATEIWINDIYGSPLTFSDPWPGVPTFGAAWTASDLNQLSNATAWVLNRSALIPQVPMLSERYGLGSCAGPDARPVYSGSVGRYYTEQQLRLGMQVADNTLPDLHAEVYVNGSLAWDSGTIPQGTTNFGAWISLAGVSLGSRAEIEIRSNQQATIPRSSYHFAQFTVWTALAQANTSSIYTTPSATPAAETTITQASLTSYLNNLASIVSAAKARIDAQPNFYGRVRAQRQYFARNSKPDELAQKRNPPRFWRVGDALVVHGKNVQIAYGGLTVPTNDRGVNWGDYKWNKSQQVVDGENVSTQVLWLDTVQGIYRGTAYYLSGEVRWAEESLL
jgi:hypothetical protein